jgi:UDP-2,4-diacetamido-2,4,6-trideoxy-beta-L-altropyranose hydrolase
MNIAFRLDGSVQIGTGHLMRCLTLASSLAGNGTNIRFVCRDMSPDLARQIRDRGHELVILNGGGTPSQPDEPDAPTHWSWLGSSQAQDAEQTLAALADRPSWDIVVVDHYAIAATWEKRVRTGTKLIMAIDDLADRTHDCDILLDQNLQPPGVAQYESRVPGHCRLLLGPSFALLRPEFQAQPPRPPGNPRSINLFFGGTDPSGATLLALEAVAPLCGPQLAVDVVAGSSNPHLAALAARCAALPNTDLHVDARNMAELFARADLGLGAGGSASLERCCMGLPALLIVTAANQMQSTVAFDKLEAAINLGLLKDIRIEEVRSRVSALLADRARLDHMRRSAMRLVDGKGTDRVTTVIAQELARMHDDRRNQIRPQPRRSS